MFCDIVDDMELKFKNNVDFDEEVIENNDGFNIILWLYDEQYEEMVKRSKFTEETGKTFRNVADSDEYFTACFNVDKNGKFLNLILEFDYHEYYVPLTEEEIKNLMNDMKVQAERKGTSVEELIG